jgi:hypothetical protein
VWRILKQPKVNAMTLNSRGQILNVSAAEKIAAVYWPLVDRVLEMLWQSFGETLHSVYIYGSIAEGRARPGYSDADFIVVFKHEVEDPVARLNEIAAALLSEYGQLILKIDLPSATEAEIMSPEQLYGWGAYLKILGLPVYGEDLRSALPLFRPGHALTRAWNGDLRQQIEAALHVLRSDASEEAKQRARRGISGTALRALFMLIAPELQVWTTVFREQSQYVIAHFSAHAELCRYLAEARVSEKPLPEFIGKLESFAQVCLPMFEAKLEQG